MCDTFGKLIKKGEYAIFGKNSDREKEEPQVLQFIPAKNYKSKKLKTTYLEIEQAEHTHAILISRPTWMWGAEMGVNEFGVCIGNEALYFKNYNNSKTGLLGMDLVRLALERARSAKEAVDVIINLLTAYGQGGVCSKKNKDLYDNSFLIMDLFECYVLETKNKTWLYKKCELEAISNCVSVKKADGFNECENFFNEKQLKETPSGIGRRKQMLKPLKKLRNVYDAFKILRLHNKNKTGICMHGEYSTTSSMIVELNKNQPPKIYFTGSSHPCCSMFKFYQFGDKIDYPICGEKIDHKYWDNQKISQNNIIGFKNKRKMLEKNIIKNNIPLNESIELEKNLFDN